jgi:hypothetical protein
MPSHPLNADTSVATTECPRLASTCAVAIPMPRAAPVIKTLSVFDNSEVRLRIVVSLLGFVRQPPHKSTKWINLGQLSPYTSGPQTVAPFFLGRCSGRGDEFRRRYRSGWKLGPVNGVLGMWSGMSDANGEKEISSAALDSL